MKLQKLAGIALGTLLVLAGALAVLSTKAPAVSAAAADTMTITDKSGSGLSNYPLQFGRPFVQGEIPGYPQVLLNGTPVLTQADVKNRYPDGSVKFAVISVMIPSVPGGGSATLSFRNQASGNNTPLSSAQMLDAAYNFDATMTLAQRTGTSTASSTTVTASARTMLQNGAYTYWTSGPVATTVLLADDSAARAYDIGFDSYHSFRPRFYATFWPATHQVTVRFVGENTNSTTLENMTYDLSLSVGTTHTNVYTQAAVEHSYMTRWTKSYWIGGDPSSKVNIDYNLAYLTSTRYFPNYDTSVTAPESTLSSTYSHWSSSAHTKINDNANWVKGMGTTGDRGDIGAQTIWNTLWTYSGDWRLRTVALNMADLAAGGWPLSLREGDATAKIDRGQSMPGLGLPASPYAHPSWWIPSNSSGYRPPALTSERPSATTRGWSPDAAHQPDPFYAPYVLTGDFFYLESLQLWASADAFLVCPGGNAWCKGPGSMQGIHDQIRGDAWLFRTRTNATFATPDDQTAIKTFLTQLTDEAIAQWAGKMGVEDSSFKGTAAYNWGYSNKDVSYRDSPLHFYGCTNHGDCSVPEWMQGYYMIALGWAADRGFETRPLIKWLSYNYNSRFVNPAPYNPFNLVLYYTHVRDATGHYYQTWSELGTESPSASATSTHISVGANDYATIWAGAAAYAAPEAGGDVMWNFVTTNIRNQKSTIYYNGTDSRWNILPRTAPNTTTVPPPVTTGTTPVVTLSALPATVSAGETSVLSWTATNATSCTGTGFTAAATSGTATVTPQATSTTYSITCTGTGGSATKTAVVAVRSATTNTPAPAITLTATPSAIDAGATAALAWSATNATSCTGTGFTATGISGTAAIKPLQSTTYSVTCTGAGGSSTKTAAVTVRTVPVPAVRDIQVTGDFDAWDNCSALATPGSCLISLAFTPTGTGVRTGTLTFYDEAAAKTQTIALRGVGVAVPTTATTTATSTQTSTTTAATSTGSSNQGSAGSSGGSSHHTSGTHRSNSTKPPSGVLLSTNTGAVSVGTAQVPTTGVSANGSGGAQAQPPATVSTAGGVKPNQSKTQTSAGTKAQPAVTEPVAADDASGEPGFSTVPPPTVTGFARYIIGGAAEFVVHLLTPLFRLPGIITSFLTGGVGHQQQTAAVILYSPSTLDFGNQTVNTTSPVKTITVTSSL